MTSNLTHKDDNLFYDILQQLTKLSKEMNDAVQQKDLFKIEQAHLKKQELINKLNLLIVAKKSSKH